jgi:5-formyltetrahydrofolate cyclo-ligase
MPGGVETLAPDKDNIRRVGWERLQESGAARFPGAWGRIPNFVGAETAAARLRDLEIWQRARVIKCNPDAPQLPVRRAALEDGKTVYMATPRLRSEQCFVELDPARLDVRPREAASIKGALQYGQAIAPSSLPEIDLVVCGSVAVSADGSRIGKGGGYSDLEYALATELGKITRDTPVVTTVHQSQLWPKPLPMREHDVPLDYVVTPDEAIACRGPYKRPGGIYWDMLPRERIRKIPPLERLWREAGQRSGAFG